MEDEDEGTAQPPLEGGEEGTGTVVPCESQLTTPPASEALSEGGHLVLKATQVDQKGLAKGHGNTINPTLVGCKQVKLKTVNKFYGSTPTEPNLDYGSRLAHHQAVPTRREQDAHLMADNRSDQEWSDFVPETPQLQDDQEVNINKLHRRLAMSLKRNMRAEELKEAQFLLEYSDLEPNDFITFWKWLESTGKIKPGEYSQLEEAVAPSHRLIIKEFKENMISEASYNNGWVRHDILVKDVAVLLKFVEDAQRPLMREVMYAGTVFKNAVIGVISKQGGKIRQWNGSAFLEIPPNAVGTETVFWIFRSPAKVQQGNQQFYLANGLAEYSLPVLVGPSGVPFRKEVMLTIRCLRLPHRNDPTPIEVLKKTTENDSWHTVGTCYVDDNDMAVRISLKSFSSYILGMPVSSSPRPVSVHILIQRYTDITKAMFKDRRNKLNVFFIMNDISYIEEFIADKCLDIHRETCLFLDTTSDVTVKWTKRNMNKEAGVAVEYQKKEILPQQYIQNLAEMAVFLAVAKPETAQSAATAESVYEDLLILEQNGQEIIKLPFDQDEVLPSDCHTMPIDIIETQKNIAENLVHISDDQEQQRIQPDTTRCGFIGTGLNPPRVGSSKMSTINIVFEGKRKKLALTGRTFSSIKAAVKERFQLEEVVLVAKQKDGTECDLWDDADLEKLPTTTEIRVYEHLENPLAIKLGTEKHALDIISSSNTALIKVAREVVMKDFDVPEFVGRLGEFVTCVRRAHYHLIAGGKHKQAIGLMNLGRDTLKPLSEKCKMTLDIYSSTTREILGKVQAMFAYCRDGLDDCALINLDHLGKLAAKMKDESVARANELEEAMRKTKVVLDEAQTDQANKGEEEYKKAIELEDEKKNIESLTTMRVKNESAIEEAASAKQAYKEINKFGWNNRYAFKGKSAHQKYNDWIEKREKKIAAEKAAVGAEDQASATKMQEEDKHRTGTKLEKDYEKVTTLLDCLRKAVDAMLLARLTMQQIASFWEKMELATNSISRDQPFVKNVRMATGKERREAIKQWSSREFKMEGIAYMARWVAIRDISTACSTGMSKVGKDMDLFLIENPSRVEAAELIAGEPSVEQKSRNFYVKSLFDESDCVNPSDEEEARKCFQLASALNAKCSVAVQVSDSISFSTCIAKDN